MSLKTLPLLVINLGGEMLYILDQRLRAQNVSDDKTQKGVWSEEDRKRVLNDIIRTMFNKAFTEELLKPQDLYSHRALRTVLTRIAHSSIMRLNPASMDKLYDLMTMAFKYQILLCPRPRDLMLISFNHIDSVRELVRDSPSVVNQINETQRQLIEMYTPLSDGEFQFIRQTLLILFQDMHIRVSIFLKENLQSPNGRFVLPASGPVPQGSEVPGLIRSFNSKGREVRRREFPTGGCYTSAVREGSFEMFGDRVTRLGTNMYCANLSELTHATGNSKHSGRKSKVDTEPNLLAKEELNLLSKLMGSTQLHTPHETAFRVNLFSTDQEEEEEAGASGGTEEQSLGVINIQATTDHVSSTALAQIVGEFTDDRDHTEAPRSKGDDLLTMMDNL